MGLKRILLHIIVVAFANSDYVNYKDYKLYKIIPKSNDEVKILSGYENNGDFIFWSPDQTSVMESKEVRIMVKPDKQREFEEHLKNEGVEFHVLVEDVQKLVDDTLRRLSPNRLSNEYSWDYYQTLDEINEWLEKMANDYPDVCSIVNMGTSFHGRNITGLIIDFKKKENATIGFIEGGIHAREWISPATTTWIIDKFLTSSDPEIRSFAENIVWHIFPVTNPDGYVYSFTNPLERQMILAQISSLVLLGTPEPETRAIVNYVNSLQEQEDLVYYLSLHSYMQAILIPYMSTIGPDMLQVPNYADLYEIAIRSVTKLQQRYNTTYNVGGIRDILFGAIASGGSADWAKGVAQIPIVMLYEMRDALTGPYGFLLPPEQIILNCEEVMDSLIEMDRVTRQMGYYRANGNVLSMNLVLLLAVIFVSYVN